MFVVASMLFEIKSRAFINICFTNKLLNYLFPKHGEINLIDFKLKE